MTGVDVSVAQDGGILKAVLTEGLGTATPSFGSEVLSFLAFVCDLFEGYCSLHWNIERW